jgi:hypothetical protein
VNIRISALNSNNSKKLKKWEPNREGLRFKEFIDIKKEKGDIDIDEKIIKSISNEASDILGKCINPNNFEKINLDSTGLVVGQVQSGKTLSMTAVSALAMDNGFGIVIVMSGAVSPLSFQTAERIAEELEGRRVIKIINNPREDWSEEENKEKIKNFCDNFNDEEFDLKEKKTLIIITHKNPSRINDISTIFEDLKNYLYKIPTLIIDDECDHHSLNSKDSLNDITKLTPKKRLKRLEKHEIYEIRENDTWESIAEIHGSTSDKLISINRIEDEKLPTVGNLILLVEQETITFEEIIKLRSVFLFHTYLGYTATPQALDLIDTANFLKPSFPHILPPGNNYTGLNFFFPKNTDPEKFDHIKSHHIKFIEDEIDDLVSDNDLPPSLNEAIQVFLIGVACGRMNKDHDDKKLNRTMIIHPHSETTQHRQFKKFTNSILESFKNGLINKDDVAYKEIKDELKITFEKFKKETPKINLPNFDDNFIKEIKMACAETEVIEFNARETRIKTIKWKDNYSRILVGGVGLERGYTVKGLTVSYLSRRLGGKQEDTILQRARFFGYHNKYQEFIQVYLKRDLQDYYRQISEINSNFLNDLNEFIKTGKPFSEFEDGWWGTNAAQHELSRKGLVRSNRLLRFRSDEPIVNRYAHRLSAEELNGNRIIYLKLKDRLKKTLVPIADLDGIVPKYKNWAENRKMKISLSMTCGELFNEYFKDIKFFDNEKLDFKLVKMNLGRLAYLDEHKDTIFPIIFMNDDAENPKDTQRGLLEGSNSINPHAGKDENFKYDSPITYNKFPGDRNIHYDYLIGAVQPSKKPLGKQSPTLQISFFNKITGTNRENVPYFSIYPTAEWADLINIKRK